MKRKNVRINIILAGLIILSMLIGIIVFLQKKTEDGDEEQESLFWNDQVYLRRDDLEHILILGVDKEEVMSERDDDGNSVGQADAIYLVTLDETQEEISIAAIPRDTWVEIDMYDGSGIYHGTKNAQITLQYAYGDGQTMSCELVKKRVEELLHIDIDHYLALNLSTIAVINDAVGGVTVTMDEDYTLFDSEFVKGATVCLEGEQALHYLQLRDTHVEGSATTRILRQEMYLYAFMDQAKMALKKNPFLLFGLLSDIEGNYETDLSIWTMMKLAKKAASIDAANIKMWTLPGRILQAIGNPYEEYHLNQTDLMEQILLHYYESVAAD